MNKITNKPIWAIAELTGRIVSHNCLYFHPTKAKAQEHKKWLEEKFGIIEAPPIKMLGPFKLYSEEALDAYIRRKKLYRQTTLEQDLVIMKKQAKKLLRSKKAAREFLKQIRIPKSAFKGD